MLTDHPLLFSSTLFTHHFINELLQLELYVSANCMNFSTRHYQGEAERLNAAPGLYC